MRPRVNPSNPKTTAQLGVRGNLAKAAAAFKNLTTAQVAAWKAYANTIMKHNPVSGDAYSPTAINVFVALAAKFLQVNPSGTIPVTPPASAFGGDSITVTATAGTGQITFTGSGINSANVKTELLLLPLDSKNCTPFAGNYRTKAFYAFTNGSLTTTVTVTTGYYAAAYRFVNTQTGQETLLVTLPVLTVAMALDDELPLAA